MEINLFLFVQVTKELKVSKGSKSQWGSMRCGGFAQARKKQGFVLEHGSRARASIFFGCARGLSHCVCTSTTSADYVSSDKTTTT